MADKMDDVVDIAHEAADGQDEWIVGAAAVAIAVVATFMALCGVKADNVDYAIIQENADAVDMWAMYQSKSMKQYMFELQRDSFRALRLAHGDGLSADARRQIEGDLQRYEESVARYEQEKEEVSGEAKGHERTRDRLNEVANKLDLGEVCLSMSIALMAITILTKRRWLFVVAALPGVIGLVLCLAALMNLSFSVPLPAFLT